MSNPQPEELDLADSIAKILQQEIIGRGEAGYLDWLPEADAIVKFLKEKNLLATPVPAPKGADPVTPTPRVGGRDKTVEMYGELLMAVQKKFDGESRHETALRYIRERESQKGDPKASQSAPTGGAEPGSERGGGE